MRLSFKSHPKEWTRTGSNSRPLTILIRSYVYKTRFQVTSQRVDKHGIKLTTPDRTIVTNYLHLMFNRAVEIFQNTTCLGTSKLKQIVEGLLSLARESTSNALIICNNVPNPWDRVDDSYAFIFAMLPQWRDMLGICGVCKNGSAM